MARYHDPEICVATSCLACDTSAINAAFEELGEAIAGAFNSSALGEFMQEVWRDWVTEERDELDITGDIEHHLVIEASDWGGALTNPGFEDGPDNPWETQTFILALNESSRTVGDSLLELVNSWYPDEQPPDPDNPPYRNPPTPENLATRPDTSPDYNAGPLRESHYQRDGLEPESAFPDLLTRISTGLADWDSTKQELSE